MFAFILEELRDWRESRMRRRLATVAVAVALVSAASLLQPLLLASAVVLAFAYLGWTDGNRYHPTLSARRILLTFPASTRDLVIGKALSGFALWCFALLALSPPIALSALAWGLRPAALAACVLAWLGCYLASLGLGFASSMVFEKSDGLPGLLLMVAWLAIFVVIEPVAPANPLVQVWAILKDSGGRAPLLGMGATFLAACGFLAAAGLALSIVRRRQHGR
jgi:hypothetical protein